MNPTEQFRAAVQEALEGLREQLGTDSGEPLRRGELSYVEEALASIQASTVLLLDGIRPHAHKLMEEGYRIDIALQTAIDQLIKDLSNE